jgi:hypothetical protein
MLEGKEKRRQADVMANDYNNNSSKDLECR